MIPNNNLSVLPWYTSIEQQNARKWWIYGRTYPLFTPACFILPFQIIRTAHLYKYEKLSVMQFVSTTGGVLLSNGTIYHGQVGNAIVREYSIDGEEYIYLENLPQNSYPLSVSVVALNANDEVLDTFTPVFDQSGLFNGGWELPVGTSHLYVQTSVDGNPTTASVYDADRVIASAESFKLYTKDGELVGDYTDTVVAQMTVKPVRDTDVLVYPGTLPFAPSIANGQYYAVVQDAENTWYSEIFTVVNDISPYLKITWWNIEDFAMDAGTIVYENPAFKNILYLQSDLAKPEYPFDEEVEKRDGYYFPIKQISKKLFKFSFLASEYLLDVMRFIRMSDFAEVEYRGQRYSVDSFLISPEWEDNGDVASVEAEFDTATVAKKIGLGYVKAQRGDFNDDFNNDFNNQ